MKNSILQAIENHEYLMIFDGDFLPDGLDVNKIFMLSEFDRFIDWVPEEEGEEYSIELPILEVGKSEQGVLYNQTGEYVIIELECFDLFDLFEKCPYEIDVIVKDIWRY